MAKVAGNKNINEVMKENAENIFNQTSALIETIKLPSRGLIPGIPEEITIRAIQRKDKKKILLADVDNIVIALLQECIVSPKNFNVYNLLPFEINYLIYRLRVLSYGNTNTFNETCPYCGEVNEVEVDLNDIPIIPVSDDFKTTFDIGPLPISKAIISCKLLSEGETIAISKSAKEFENNTGNKYANLDMLWESRIIAINGNQNLSPFEKTSFLDSLTDLDSEYLMEYYNLYEGNYGLQTKLSYVCDKCKRKVSSDMPSIYTFFRPKFEINISK